MNSNNNYSLLIKTVQSQSIKILIESLKQRNLIFTNVIWDAISTIIGTILAIFVLHESINNWQQWVGIIIILIGIVFLNYGKKPL